MCFETNLFVGKILWLLRLICALSGIVGIELVMVIHVAGKSSEVEVDSGEEVVEVRVAAKVEGDSITRADLIDSGSGSLTDTVGAIRGQLCMYSHVQFYFIVLQASVVNVAVLVCRQPDFLFVLVYKDYIYTTYLLVLSN